MEVMLVEEQMEKDDETTAVQLHKMLTKRMEVMLLVEEQMEKDGKTTAVQLHKMLTKRVFKYLYHIILPNSVRLDVPW